MLGSGRQLGSLKTHFDTLESQAYPYKPAGLVAQGFDTYKSLGCASCHTQQVRRAGYGYDKAVRGWGDRQSVARDYLWQEAPAIGASRRGPDLANFGDRAIKAGVDRAKLLTQLYTGIPGMPSYAFLFEERPVVGAKLANALAVKTAPGMQIIPTTKAEALVTYLLSLRQDYAYPEAQSADAEEAQK